MITFIDSPSSTRRLKCQMITIVIEKIILSLSRLVLETVVRRFFLSSWSTSRVLRIIMNTFGRFCLSVSSPNDFFYNIMKYCVRIMSINYVRFGNIIFQIAIILHFFNRFLSYAIINYFSVNLSIRNFLKKKHLLLYRSS